MLIAQKDNGYTTNYDGHILSCFIDEGQDLRFIENVFLWLRLVNVWLTNHEGINHLLNRGVTPVEANLISCARTTHSIIIYDAFFTRVAMGRPADGLRMDLFRSRTEKVAGYLHILCHYSRSDKKITAYYFQVFNDASEAAYDIVVHLQLVNIGGFSESSLPMAKSSLAL